MKLPRLLFDEHVSVPALRALRARGIDVVHVAEIGLAGSSDVAVLRHAQQHGLIVVTRDYGDFAPLVQALGSRGESFPGVLFLSSSIRQTDVAAHVRVVSEWLAAATEVGGNPVASGLGWLR